MANSLKIKVNGLTHGVTASLDTPLLYVLHNELHLHGPRFGCGLAQCGACSVLLDGKEIRSCVTPVAAVSGKSITTLEGLPALWAAQRGTTAAAPALHPLQQAWIDVQVPHCGYCQNGMMIQAADLLATTKNPSEDQIRTAMNGHLCRCGTYPQNPDRDPEGRGRDGEGWCSSDDRSACTEKEFSRKSFVQGRRRADRRLLGARRELAGQAGAGRDPQRSGATRRALGAVRLERRSTRGSRSTPTTRSTLKLGQGRARSGVADRPPDDRRRGARHRHEPDACDRERHRRHAEQRRDGRQPGDSEPAASLTRAAAAACDQTLLGLASTKLGVPVGSLTVAKGVVSGGGKTSTYGELLGGKLFNVTIPASYNLAGARSRRRLTAGTTRRTARARPGLPGPSSRSPATSWSASPARRGSTSRRR